MRKEDLMNNDHPGRKQETAIQPGDPVAMNLISSSPQPKTLLNAHRKKGPPKKTLFGLFFLLLISLLLHPHSVSASGIGFMNFRGDVTITNSAFTDNFNAIQLTTTNTASIANKTLGNIWIYSNSVRDSIRHGIRIDLSDSGAITIENNFLDNANTPDTGANSINGRVGIRIKNHHFPSIANNTIQNFGRSGIQLLSIANIIAVGNTLKNNGSQDLLVGDEHFASGIQTKYSSFVNLSDNYITSNKFSGIAAYATDGTIGNGNTIKFNGVVDSGSTGSGGSLENCIIAAGSGGDVRGGVFVRDLGLAQQTQTLELCGDTIVSNYENDIAKTQGGTVNNCGVFFSQGNFFASNDDTKIYIDETSGDVDLNCANPPAPYDVSISNSTINAALDGKDPFGIVIVGGNPSQKVTVRNCTIKNAAVDSSSRATVTNGAETRAIGAGIFIANDASPLIYSNYIVSNGWGIIQDRSTTEAGASGIMMRCASPNASIYNNIIASNKSDGLVGRETGGKIGLNGQGNTFRNNGRGGIGIFDGTTSNLEIVNNTIINNKRGIGAYAFTGNLIKISDNYIYSNTGNLSSAGGIGFIDLASTAPVTIENNIIASNNGWKVGGIGLTSTNAAINVVNFNVYSNTISNNKQSGIGIRWAQAFTIRNNVIFSNSGNASDPANEEYYSFGIQLRDSHISSSGIVDNIIHSNKNAGIGAYNCTGTIGPNNEIKFNGDPDASSLPPECIDVGLGGTGGISAKGLITADLYAETNTLASNYPKNAQHGSGSTYDFIVNGQVITPTFMDRDSAVVFVNSRGKVFVNGEYYSDTPVIDGVADPTNFANISDGLKVWGIAVAGGASGVTIRNCNVFQNNTTANTLGPGGTNLGGGIFVGPNAEAMIYSNNVYNNSDPGAAIPPKGEGGTAGIVLRCSSSAVTVRNNDITDNRGDGISVKDSSVVIGDVNAANSIINNGRMGIGMTGGGDPRFGYNYIFSNGNGGIGLYSITSSVQVYSNYIFSNIGKDNPGGVGVIYMDGATADIRNNVILQNTSERVNNVPWGIGIAESTSGNVIIENNVVASNGREQGSTLVGGIGIQGVSAILPATLDNLTITSNRISNHGKKRAGIAFKWYKGPVNIRNNRKDGLGLYANGEGIRFQELAEGTTVTISNNIFLDNNNVFSEGGAGLEFKNCSFVNVEIDSNLMSHNTWNTGDTPRKSVISFEYSRQYSNNFIKIRRNTIKNSNNKGIIFRDIDGNGGLDIAYVSLFSNQIYSNIGGMGIFDLSDAQVNVEGNSIYANQSSDMGGLGLSTTNGTFSFMNNAIFSNTNTGSGPGGMGFYELNTLITIQLEGNSVYNNNGWKVGGIGFTNNNAADLSTVTLYSNAIFRNRQSGIAIWNGSLLNIQNNKISSNGWAGAQDVGNDEFYGSGIMTRNASFGNSNISNNTITSNWFAGIALYSSIGSVGGNNTIMYNGVSGGGSGGGSMENCVVVGGSAGDIRGGILAKGLGGADEITIACLNDIIDNYDTDYAKTGGGTLRSCTNVATSFFASKTDAAFYFDDTSGTVANLDCAAPTAEQLAIYNIQNSTINAENKKFGIIVVGNGANTTIKNCTIKNAAMDTANRATVTNGGETRYFGTGIFITNNASPIIHSNYIFSNGWGVIQDEDPVQAGASGIQMRCADANTSIYNNAIVSNRSDGIVIRESGGLIGLSNQGNTFRNNGRNGIGILDGTTRNLEVVYNAISNNMRGIGAVDFDGNILTISNNLIHNNSEAGIGAKNSSPLVISDNSITSNGSGENALEQDSTIGDMTSLPNTQVRLNASSSTVNNYYDGMYLHLDSAAYGVPIPVKLSNYDGATKLATVTPAWTSPPSVNNGYQIYKDPDAGIRFRSCDNVTVQTNTISNNAGMGLSFSDNTSGNQAVITGNYVYSNIRGMGVGRLALNVNQGSFSIDNRAGANVFDNNGKATSSYPGAIGFKTISNVHVYINGNTITNNYLRQVGFEDANNTNIEFYNNVFDYDPSMYNTGLGVNGNGSAMTAKNNIFMRAGIGMSGFGQCCADADKSLAIIHNNVFSGGAATTSDGSISRRDTSYGDSIITSNYFDGSGPEARVVTIDEEHDLIFSGNTIVGGGLGVNPLIYPGGIAKFDGVGRNGGVVKITGNTFENILTYNERAALQVSLNDQLGMGPITIANNTIRNVSIGNPSTEYQVGAFILESGSQDSNISILDNIIESTGYRGIGIKNTQNLTLIGNKISRIEKAGIQIINSDNLVMDNNQVWSCGSGNMGELVDSNILSTTAYQSPNYVYFSSGASGIQGGMLLKLQGSAEPKEYLITSYNVANNYAMVSPNFTTPPSSQEPYKLFSRPDTGISIAAANPVIISNNTIKNNNGQGLAIIAPSGSGTVENNSIHNNQIGGIGINSIPSTASLVVSANMVFDNSISVSGTAGIGFNDVEGTVSVKNNFIYSNVSTASGMGGMGFLELAATATAWISGNSVYNNDGWRAAGIGITNTNSTDLTGVDIYSNAILRNKDAGLGIWNGSLVNIQSNKIFSNGWSGTVNQANKEVFGSGIALRSASFANTNITNNYIRSNWFAGISAYSTVGSVGGNNTIVYNGVWTSNPITGGGGMQNCEVAAASAGDIRGGVLVKDLGNGELTLACNNGVYSNYYNDLAQTGSGTLSSCGNTINAFFASSNDTVFYFDASSGHVELNCLVDGGAYYPHNGLVVDGVIDAATAKGSPVPFGIIIVGGGSDVTITNCSIKNAAMNEASRATVTNNGETRYIGTGIFITNDATPSIANNTLYSNGWGILDDSSYTSGPAGASGIQMRCAGDATTIINNTFVNNKNDGIVIRESGGIIGLVNQGNTFFNNGRGGIGIYDGTTRNMEIGHNVIYSNQRGIGIIDFDGTFLNITSNKIYSNVGNLSSPGAIGFKNLAAASTNTAVTIQNNIISSNSGWKVGGIGLTSENPAATVVNFNIFSNTIANNQQSGIGVDWAEDFIIRNNVIFSNGLQDSGFGDEHYAFGIQVRNSSFYNNSIQANSIRNNKFAGIGAYTTSGSIGPNNTIEYNGDTGSGGLCVGIGGSGRGGISARDLALPLYGSGNTFNANIPKDAQNNPNSLAPFYNEGALVKNTYWADTDVAADGKITKSTLINNATFTGGNVWGMTVIGPYDVTIQNSTIKNNCTDSQICSIQGETGQTVGGGILVAGGAKVYLDNNLIASNGANAKTAGNGGYAGVAMRCADSETYLVNNTIRNNKNDGIVTYDTDGYIGLYGQGNIVHDNARNGVGLNSFAGGNPKSGPKIAYNSIYSNQAFGVASWGLTNMNATLLNNTIKDNHLGPDNTLGPGGTDMGGGVGLISFNSQAFIDNNTIKNNRGSSGGGIGVSASNSATFSIKNNLVMDNISSMVGGIGFNDLSASQVYLEGNRVASNLGDKIGAVGATVVNSGGYFSFVNNNIMNNIGSSWDSAVENVGGIGFNGIADVNTAIYLSKNTLINNKAYDAATVGAVKRVGAVGISLSNATVSIVNNRVGNNQGSCIGGIGFDMYGSGDPTATAVIFSNRIFGNVNNKSSLGAGGLAFDYLDGTVTVLNNRIYNNSNLATGAGGMGFNQIQANASVLVKENSIYNNDGYRAGGLGITNSNTTDVSIYSNTIFYNYQLGLGIWDASFLNIQNNFIVTNGLIEAYDPALGEYYASGIQLRNSTFNNNNISGNTIRNNPFSGIQVYDSGGTIGPNNVIEYNGKDIGGGGLCTGIGGSAVRGGIAARELNSFGDMVIEDPSLLVSNNFTEGAVHKPGSSYDLTFRNAKVESTKLNDTVAVVYVTSDTTINCADPGSPFYGVGIKNGKVWGVAAVGNYDVTIINCDIADNCTNATDCDLVGTEGSRIGGGVLVSGGADVYMTNNNIYNNVYTKQTNEGGMAGVTIRCAGAGTTLFNNNIYNNKNDGIALFDTVSYISQNTIENNNGNGIGVSSFSGGSAGTSVIYNNYINSNTEFGVATSSLQNMTLSIVNNVISSNNASGPGGGVGLNEMFSSAFVGDNTIRNNFSGSGTGGIGTSQSSGTITITANVVHDNTSTSGPGGIGVTDQFSSGVFVAESNIVRNNSGTAAGGIGGKDSNGAVLVVNNSVYSNTGSTLGGIGIINQLAGQIVVNGNSVRNNDGTTTGGIGFTASNATLSVMNNYLYNNISSNVGGVGLLNINDGAVQVGGNTIINNDGGLIGGIGVSTVNTSFPFNITFNYIFSHMDAGVEVIAGSFLNIQDNVIATNGWSGATGGNSGIQLKDSTFTNGNIARNYIRNNEFVGIAVYNTPGYIGPNNYLLYNGNSDGTASGLYGPGEGYGGAGVRNLEITDTLRFSENEIMANKYGEVTRKDCYGTVYNNGVEVPCSGGYWTDADSITMINQSDVTLDCGGSNISGGSIWGVAVVGPVVNVTIRNCNIFDNGTIANGSGNKGQGVGGGILVAEGANVYITNNNIYNNGVLGSAGMDGYAGIALKGAGSGTTVVNNNIHDNLNDGIVILDAQGVIGYDAASGNTITANGRNGIGTKSDKGGGNVRIGYNDISNNDQGVALSGDTTISLYNNSIFNNTTRGLAIGGGKVGNGGSITGVGANSVNLASGDNSTAGFYDGWVLQMTSGSANPSHVIITDYTGGASKTATINQNWATPPTNGNSYEIHMAPMVKLNAHDNEIYGSNQALSISYASPGADIQIYSNDIHDNSNNIAMAPALGIRDALPGSRVWVRNNNFTNNKWTLTTGSAGVGGVGILDSSGRIRVSGNAFRNNGSTSGAALAIDNALAEADILIDNNIFSGFKSNLSTDGIGDLNIQDIRELAYVDIYSNYFHNNATTNTSSGPRYAGIRQNTSYGPFGFVVIDNNIFTAGAGGSDSAVAFHGIDATNRLNLSGDSSAIYISNNIINGTPNSGIQFQNITGGSDFDHGRVYVRGNYIRNLPQATDARAIQWKDDIGSGASDFVNLRIQENPELCNGISMFARNTVHMGELRVTGGHMFGASKSITGYGVLLLGDKAQFYGKPNVFFCGNQIKDKAGFASNDADGIWWGDGSTVAGSIGAVYLDNNVFSGGGGAVGWRHTAMYNIYVRNNRVRHTGYGNGKISTPGGIGFAGVSVSNLYFVGNNVRDTLNHGMGTDGSKGAIIENKLMIANNTVGYTGLVGIGVKAGDPMPNPGYILGNTVFNTSTSGGEAGIGIGTVGTFYFRNNLAYNCSSKSNVALGLLFASKSPNLSIGYFENNTLVDNDLGIGAADVDSLVYATGNAIYNSPYNNADTTNDYSASTGDFVSYAGKDFHLSVDLNNVNSANLNKSDPYYNRATDGAIRTDPYDAGVYEYNPTPPSTTDSIPTVTINSAIQSATATSLVNINYTGKDPNADEIYYLRPGPPGPATGDAEGCAYSLDGGLSWHAMDDITTFDPALAYFASGSGTVLNYAWHVGRELPNVETDQAKIRLQVSDMFNNSAADTYGPFDIDTRAPRNLDYLHQLNAPDGNSIVLEWTEAEDPFFLTYEVIYTNGSNITIDRSCTDCQKIDYTSASSLGNITTTGMTIGNLMTTTSYSFNIFAVDSIGNYVAAYDKSTDLYTAEPAAGPVQKDTLNVSTMIQVPAGEAQRGNEEGVYAFSMFMGSGTANVTAINLTWGTSNAATDGSDVQNARLYADTGTLGVFDGETTPIATLTYAGGYYGNSTLTGQTITNTPKYYLVTLDILAGATLGDNLQLALETSDHGTNPGVSFSDDPANVEISLFARKEGNIQIISDVDTLYFTNTAVSGPVTKYKEQGVLAFNLNAGASGPATATVTLMNLTWGTSNDAVYGVGNDVLNARLYEDLGTVGTFEPGTDTFITALSYASNYFTASGITEVVGTTGAGTDKDYIVTLDILGTAVANNNVRLAMEASSYPGLAVDSPDVVNSFSKTDGTLLQMVEPSHVTVTVAENVPAGSDLLPGEGDPNGIPLQRIKFTSTGGAATVTNIIIKEVSSASQSDISWIAFYTDDGDATFEPGTDDTIIGSASPSGVSKFELDLTPYNWEVNGTKYMLATVKVAVACNSGTVIRTRIEDGFVEVDSPNTVSVTAFESNDFNIIGVPQIRSIAGTAQRAGTGLVDVAYEGFDPDFDTVTFVSAGTQYSIANSGSWTTINTYIPNQEYFQGIWDPFNFEWNAKTDAPNVENDVYVQLQVNDGTNDSNTTISNVFSLDTKAPGAPGTLSTSGVTPYSIPLSWTASSGDINWNQYEIYFKACNGCTIDRNDPGLSLKAVTGGPSIVNTTLDSTNNGIQPSTTYRMNIWAVDTFENVTPAVSEYLVTTGDILTVAQNGTQPSGSVEQGESTSGVVMQKIRLTAAVNTVTVDSLKVQQTGTAVAGDIAWVEFHNDANNDGVPESLIGTTTESAGEYATSTGLGYVVTAGAPRYVLVVVKAADAANTLNNITMSMQSGNVGVLSPDAAVETAFSGGTFGITGNSLTPFKPTQPSGYELTASSLNNVVMKIGYSASYGYVDIDALTLKQIGTDTGTSIAKVKLYEDDDGDGIIDPEDSLLYSDTSVTAGEYDFTISPPFRVTAGTNAHMQVAIDTTATLEDLTTVQFQLENASKITVSAPDSVLGTNLPFTSNAFTTPSGAPTNDRLTVSIGAEISNSSTVMNATNVALLAFTAQETLGGGDGTVTINSVTLDQLAGNSTDFVANSMKLYADNDILGTYQSGTDTPVIGTYFTYTGGIWQLTGLTENVTSTAKNYIVVADLAAPEGGTIQLQLRDSAASPKGVVIDTGSGDTVVNPGDTGPTITVNKDNLTVDDSAGQIGNSTVAPSDTNVELVRFRLTSDGAGDDSVTVTQVNLSKVGTWNEADIATGTMRLYVDHPTSGTLGVYDSSFDTPVGTTFTWNTDHWELTGINETVSGTQHYLVAADIDSLATAEDIQVQLNASGGSPAGVVINPSTGTLTAHTAFPGGLITIQSAAPPVSNTGPPQPPCYPDPSYTEPCHDGLAPPAPPCDADPSSTEPCGL